MLPLGLECDRGSRKHKKIKDRSKRKQSKIQVGQIETEIKDKQEFIVFNMKDLLKQKKEKIFLTQNYQISLFPTKSVTPTLQKDSKTLQTTKVQKVNESSLALNKRQKSKGQLKLEKTVKLKELYNKKVELIHKLQKLNKETRIKTEGYENAVSSNGSPQFQTKQQLNKRFQESECNSRYINNIIKKNKPSRILSQSRSIVRPKEVIPQSLTSIENNKKVIQFIQKMHNETLKRQKNRMQNFHNLLKSNLVNQLAELSFQKNKESINGSTHFDSRYAQAEPKMKF